MFFIFKNLLFAYKNICPNQIVIRVLTRHTHKDYPISLMISTVYSSEMNYRIIKPGLVSQWGLYKYIPAFSIKIIPTYRPFLI